MTQIKQRWLQLRGLAFSLVFFALVASTVAAAAHAGPPTSHDRTIVDSVPMALDAAADDALEARPVPVKPERTKIKKGDSKRDIQVKFVEDSEVERQGQSFVSPDVAVTEVNDLLASVPGVHVRPMFSRSRGALRSEQAELEKRSGRELADLSLYFYVTLPAGASVTSAEGLIDALNALPIVEFAAAVPEPAPPPSYNFSGYQGYRLTAPDGIGATQVTGVAGARGDYVQVVDIEYSWNVNHEDLSKARAAGAFIANGTPVDPFPAMQRNHGTAVLGELSADDNGFGVTGIVPFARLRMVNASNTLGYELADAIDLAAQNVGPGDVILIEQQTRANPYQACFPSNSDCGYVAVEYYQVWYDAIARATAKGIIVVEAAGNGYQNLSGPEYATTFNGRPDSGAIIVGAGAAPAGSCGTDASGNPLGSGKPARSRLNFSNFGAFVDIQGWGECVTTTGHTGFGDWPNTSTLYNTWYTYTFSGTSSASPIVAGAAAAYSSAREAASGTRPTSTQVRQALVSTGTPQNTTSVGALGGKIGPLPNLPAALNSISSDTTPPTVTAPIQTIAVLTAKLGTTVPTKVSWSASDAGGIRSYELWISTNGAAFVRDTTLPATAKSRTYSLTVGRSYRFFVRAYDNIGNASADTLAAYGPTFTPTVTDDRSTVVKYFNAPGSTTRSWIYAPYSQAYKGTVTKSTKASEYARFTFTGRDVAFAASLGSNRGYAKVWIDGVAYSTVKLYRGTAAGAQIVASKHWATSAAHTIDVQTISSASYPTAIDVDAFVVNK